MLKFSGSIFFLFLLYTVNAQTADAWRAVDRYASEKETRLLSEFQRFLSIPNVATDTANIRKNAMLLQSMMQSRGIDTRLLEAESHSVPPVVYGEVRVPGARTTLVFYAHYDGQPVNPSTWARGLHPFQPKWVKGRYQETSQLFEKIPDADTSGEWRLYARGSSDDKGGIMAILAAYDAVRSTGNTFQCNVKFFFEGEEEQGSPHLEEILRKYKTVLSSDLWVICDGPVHQSGRKQVVFGARGDAHLTLKVYGPARPLHSGHYGNWVPNPVMNLVELLATLKDSTGRVSVAGFYDDVTPLTGLEEAALRGVPNVDAQLKTDIGFAAPEMRDMDLIHAIHLPSLNINGIESSNVGTIQANVIPTSATAVLDLRLVPGNDWKRQQQKVIDHIRRQGYFITERVPTQEERMRYEKLVQVTRGFGDNAYRTPMDWPMATKLVHALEAGTGEKVLQVPTLGGSLPLNILVKEIGARPLIVPIANPDNNQHAENENLQLRHFRDGIRMLASIMMSSW